MASNDTNNVEENISYEVRVDNNWKEFILLQHPCQDGIDDIRLNKRLCDLDNRLYGKYFRGYIGYNPSGWWQYIRVNKNDIRYKENKQ